MTNLTDIELIAAVAEKLGGKKRIPDTRFPDMCVWFFEGKAYESHKLPSADACLALLDEGWGYKINKSALIHVRLFDSDGREVSDSVGETDLPRAILLAILEVK